MVYRNHVFHSKSHSFQQLDGLFLSRSERWIQGSVRSAELNKNLGGQLWLVHSLWCGDTNGTSPEMPQTCSEEAASRTQPTAWSRTLLPQFLLLLLAAQVVFPAVKGTFTAFRRKQRGSVLGLNHKCWSCYSPVICQQTVMGWMIRWRSDLMILDVFSNLSDSVIGTPITAPYFKLPMTCPKFIQLHFQPRYLQPCVTAISGKTINEYFFFNRQNRFLSLFYWKHAITQNFSKRGWSATGQVTT